MGLIRLGLNLIWGASNAFNVYICPMEQVKMVKRVESDL